MKLIVSGDATADVRRLYVFLADKSTPAADRAVAALDNAIRSLEFFPDRGRPSGTPNVRELIIPFGRSSYVLRYAHFADVIVILRIWHSREDR